MKGKLAEFKIKDAVSKTTQLGPFTDGGYSSKIQKQGINFKGEEFVATFLDNAMKKEPINKHGFRNYQLKQLDRVGIKSNNNCGYIKIEGHNMTKVKQVKQVYQTTDGELFEDEEKAVDWQEVVDLRKDLHDSGVSNDLRVSTTLAARALLKNFDIKKKTVDSE